ncbi:MAG: hypothetical protein DF280_01230 ['Brassica napus' phytoplasma]|nr:MAG: hypothetical protein DF280_01230 ['Brassica napus' phytoplasma]
MGKEARNRQEIKIVVSNRFLKNKTNKKSHEIHAIFYLLFLFIDAIINKNKLMVLMVGLEPT